jgi:hypothetical protein
VVYQGETVLAFWQSYADGREGFVPVNAVYTGRGGFRPAGPPKYSDLRTSKQGDTDFRALNGVSDDDPEALLARSSNRFGLSGISRVGFQGETPWGDLEMKRLSANVIVNEALRILKEDKDCKSFLADTTGRDPEKWLREMKEKGKIGPGRTHEGAVAEYFDTPASALNLIYGNINLSLDFYDENVGGYAHNSNFHNLSSGQARVLIVLHELGHAIGSSATNHGVGTAGKKRVAEAIYQKCFDEVVTD